MPDVNLSESTIDNGRTCPGCGGKVPPPTNGRGWRKWCSERCRKGSYGDPCVECGARTAYGAETARVPDPHCDPCRERIRADRRCERVMAMYELRLQGLGNIEVAARLGCPVTSVSAELHRLRSLGFPMPTIYRGGGRPIHGDSRVVAQEAQILGRELEKRGITPDTERLAA